MALSNRNLETFTAVVDTILPGVAGAGPAWTSPGAELGLQARLPELFAALPHDRDRADFKQLLTLLDSRAGGVVLFGRPQRFTELPRHHRADAYRRMTASRIGLVRNGARALKTIVGFLWVSTSDVQSPPAAWAAMGYPGPSSPPPDTPKPIRPEDVTGDTTLEADVVVVGSGAGGGTAAGVLAGAGLRVIVLERGGYSNEADFSHLEHDAYRSMYLDGALSSTADGGIAMLAGGTLGGGTVINYTTSFATPHRVREHWDREAGFVDVFAGEAYETSAQEVALRLNVNRDHDWPSSRASIMEKGLLSLGWHVEDMPRNVDGCTERECGWCTMGCRIGAKRSTLLTYLQDAADAGARFVVNADVRGIETERDLATGVTCTVGEHTLRVRAPTVVVAAGALNTPALLLRSRFKNPAIGRWLRLHPVTAVWGRFEQRVDPWTGILQARYGDEFADLDGDGYGFKFETAPVHPLFPAAFLGWENGASFKRDVLGLGHLSVGGILLKDRGSGRVAIRRDGSPVWKYTISKYDQAHVREGVRRGVEWMAEAGATEVITSSIRPVRYRPGSDSVDAFMERSDAVGYGSNETAYFSFHQMGSARMGAEPRRAAVNADNEVYGAGGVFVMDGSCFPTASGVNPMLSIATIAHRGATLLAERLA